METSLRGIVELISSEGICPRIYYDSVGVKTLGVGCTVSELPNIAKMSMTEYHSIPELVAMFKKALKKYENAVNGALKVSVTQPQFDALVNITFNIGNGGMKGSTFMRRINAKDSLSNIHVAIMMWDKPKEIIKRRKREADLYVTGKYTSNGTAILTDTDGKGHELAKTTRYVEVYKLLAESEAEIIPKMPTETSVQRHGEVILPKEGQYEGVPHELSWEGIQEFLEIAWKALVVNP